MSDDDGNDRTGDPALSVVSTLLAEAGLTVPDDEVARLAGLYPGMRRQIEAFHRVDCGDEVPAAVYRAAEGGEGRR